MKGPRITPRGFIRLAIASSPDASYTTALLGVDLFVEEYKTRKRIIGTQKMSASRLTCLC